MVIQVVDIRHLVAVKAKDDTPISRYLHGIKSVIVTFQAVKPKSRKINLFRTGCLV
jgi:hypothetical protein